ncbi:MAG TPA: protein kinase [Kofleriaceae bacterium]|nr:protein kinase [Kofleriaceae bacterium]
MGADLAVEEQFGPYLVYERLGIGGMATVHRALERGIEGFERIVALKRLLPHLAEDASFIKSFVREAKLASLLNHNNIVQIFELGRVGTEYFISMEYIDGRDIRRILRHARKVTGPPPIHVTVGLLLQLCDALDYAHTKVDDQGHPLGLVHRDVSPSNLLVTSAGHLKVIDFGIAKAQSSQLRTQTGRVKGKLAYMAPEAITGKELDSRSDLFAAGVIAHELLTARPLFASKNEYQTLLKVQRGDIMPPSTFNQACPPELDGIVLRALARDPDERFADAAELREHLLAMRKQYNLQTGHRDVAQWLDWAFSLEPPSGGFAGPNTLDHSPQTSSGSNGDIAAAVRGYRQHITPLPRKDEDAAVEIAWGGGEPEAAAPIELDDVPDVSAKHLGAQPRVELDDLGDDIPPPEPSHGVPRPHRDTAPERAVAQADGVDTRATDAVPTIAARGSSTSIRAANATGPIPRPKSPSLSAATLPPRTKRETLSPAVTPARERRTTAPGVVGAEVPRVEDRSAANPLATPNPDIQTGPVPDAMVTAPPRPARSLTDLSHLAQAAHEDTRDTQPSPALVLGEAAARTLPEVQRLPTTKPGHVPARAPTLDSNADPRVAMSDAEAVATTPNPVRAKKRESNINIGSSIVQRQRRSGTWLIVTLLLVAGAAATAATLYFTRGHADKLETAIETPPVPPVRTVGTVKFNIEPEDVEITIEGKTHVGSPWSIELPPGQHAIQIHRDGYKARLMSIELSPNETQTLVVGLERLSSNKEANLILTSTPLGLEVVLDGKLLPQRTPVKLPIAAGSHTIALRQNGLEVWKHELVAEASVDYEFSPSMTEAKQRERASRIVRPEPPLQLTKEDNAAPAPGTEKTVPDQPPPAPVHPPAVDDKKAEPPPAPAPTPPPAPPVQPPPAPKPVVIPHTGPVTVAPTAVTRVAGDTPTLSKTKRAEMPPVVAAKVCIDTAGAVSSVDMITKLERLTVLDLTAAIRGWRYAPYKQAGTAVPACFVVSFRVK